VEEKAEKFKETQRIMGVREFAYFISWLSFIMMKCFIILIVVTIPTMAFGAFDNSGGPGMGFSLNLIYMLCSVAQVFFLMPFFNKPASAV
jgi:ATP-binding cassette, subfamily A (ABC1), member 3